MSTSSSPGRTTNALLISGSWPSSNLTSTTGPMTCVMCPLLIDFPPILLSTIPRRCSKSPVTMAHQTGDLLLKPPTSCGGRRTHHKQEKPAARNDGVLNFQRTRRASASARDCHRELSLPVLVILLFEHAFQVLLKCCYTADDFIDILCDCCLAFTVIRQCQVIDKLVGIIGCITHCCHPRCVLTRFSIQ